MATPDVVRIDAYAALKIISHCQSALPRFVTGQLLGMATKGRLEVTQCFPFRQQDEDENSNAEEEQDQGAEYQMDVMRSLRVVNADANTVGWYSTSILGSFMANSIDTQFAYQDNIRQSVMIVYDPLRAQKGNVCLRAFRLTPQFVQVFRAKSFTLDSLVESNLTFRDIYEEISVEIYNSPLASVALLSMEKLRADTTDTTYDRLSLAVSPLLEKNIEYLLESMDHLNAEQSKEAYFRRVAVRQRANLEEALKKRRQENERLIAEGKAPLDEADILAKYEITDSSSRLESLVTAAHIDDYCQRINETVEQAFVTDFLAQGVQADDDE